MPIADDIFGNVLFQVVAMMNFNCTREERNIMLKSLSYQVSMDSEQKKRKKLHITAAEKNGMERRSALWKN